MNFATGLKRTSIYAATVVLSLAATTANAACSDPAAPGVDWVECDKFNLNLVHAQLSRANLNGANLSRAELEGANLRNADLTGVDLSGSDLSGVRLNYATWIDVRR